MVDLARGQEVFLQLEPETILEASARAMYRWKKWIDVEVTKSSSGSKGS